MNSNSPVKIHEFSTGITFDRLPNGGWVSRGFTGEYMNCTIDPVPLAMERSISNREFRIAEGTASQDPAVVARVIGQNEDSWSVVAIVSRGEDEVGRGGSFYRFFLAQGEDKIPYILAWLEEDKQSRNSMQLRTFNPLDKVSQPNDYYPQELSEPRFSNSQLEELSSNAIPIILGNKIPNLFFIHTLTLKKVKIEEEKGNYVPIAWAFNVEAVEQINRFTLVRAASENAFDVLNRAKASAARALPLALFDEQAVKSAIKGLTNSTSKALKTEYITVLAEAIGNQAIEPSHWHRIFDGQGAKNALKERIYTSQMVKLLVLRALSIPSTLPEYYDWRAEAAKSKNDVKAIAQEFELEFDRKLQDLKTTPLFEAINDNIVKGFGVFISNFLEDDSSRSLKAAIALLQKGRGLWGNKSQEFIKSLKRDLDLLPQFISRSPDRSSRTIRHSASSVANEQIPSDRDRSSALALTNNHRFKLNDPKWMEIWEEIAPYWQDDNHSIPPNQKYLKFASLFEEIEEYNIALVFYRIGQGVLPHDRFKKLTKSRRPPRRRHVYGINVQRELSWVESAFESIERAVDYLSGDTSMKRFQLWAIGLAVTSTSFMAGMVVGNKNNNLGRLNFLAGDEKPTSSVSKEEQSSSEDPRRDDPSTPPPQKDGNSVSVELTELRKKLAKNIVAINKLYNDLQKEANQPNSISKYPSMYSSSIDIESSILDRFQFGMTEKSKLRDLLKDISNISKPDRTADEVFIQGKLIDWSKEELKAAIKAIKLKINSKNLDVIKVDGDIIKKIKKEILNIWKKPISFS
jgi:hypothetical protein